MGNCCEHSKITTDNEAENLIRETIINTKIYKMSIEDVKSITRDELGICIFDIPTDYKKWITQEVYINLLNHLIYEDENQQLLLLDYEYPEFYSCLLIWILAFINENDHIKTEIVKDIIIKSDLFISYGSFKKFLSNYLSIVLRRITENFIRSHDIFKYRTDYDELINIIYREDNINNYTDKIYQKFLNFTKKKDDPRDIVKLDSLRHFFRTYKILNILSVRDDFYMNYVIKK
jgi:hypothetical protein